MVFKLELETAVRDCLNGHEDERYAAIALGHAGERLELMSCWRYYCLHNHRLLLVRGVGEQFVRDKLVPLTRTVQTRSPDLIVPGWDAQRLMLVLGFSVRQFGRWPEPERAPTSVLAWRMV